VTPHSIPNGTKYMILEIAFMESPVRLDSKQESIFLFSRLRLCGAGKSESQSQDAATLIKAAPPEARVGGLASRMASQISMNLSDLKPGDGLQTIPSRRRLSPGPTQRMPAACPRDRSS